MESKFKTDLRNYQVHLCPPKYGIKFELAEGEKVKLLSVEWDYSTRDLADEIINTGLGTLHELREQHIRYPYS